MHIRSLLFPVHISRCEKDKAKILTILSYQKKNLKSLLLLHFAAQIEQWY